LMPSGVLGHAIKVFPPYNVVKTAGQHSQPVLSLETAEFRRCDEKA
jgi:hypothetical protein